MRARARPTNSSVCWRRQCLLVSSFLLRTCGQSCHRPTSRDQRRRDDDSERLAATGGGGRRRCHIPRPVVRNRPNASSPCQISNTPRAPCSTASPLPSQSTLGDIPSPQTHPALLIARNRTPCVVPAATVHGLRV